MFLVGATWTVWSIGRAIVRDPRSRLGGVRRRVGDRGGGQPGALPERRRLELGLDPGTGGDDRGHVAGARDRRPSSRRRDTTGRAGGDRRCLAMRSNPRISILADGDVWCGGAARRRAHAVAIRGDRIVAVGTDEQVRALKGPATEVVSLAGRTVVPGFQDSHVHPAFGARNLLNVNLDDLDTKDDYLERIKAVADANPDLDWIVGGGWYGPVFASTAGPRKEDLDAIVPDRPVFLLNNDVHGAWVNSRALEGSPGSTATRPTRGTATSFATPTGLRPGASRRVPPTTSCVRW